MQQIDRNQTESQRTLHNGKIQLLCFLFKLVADDIDSTSGAQEEWTWKRTARFAGKAIYRYCNHSVEVNSQG